MTTAQEIITAVATRRGVREYNMDAGSAFRSAGGIVAAAVVDGIGNDPAGAVAMRLLAETAVRIGSTRGALAGIMAAASLIEDPGVEEYAPDAVAVLALAEPGRPTLLAWVGDAHVYGWDGSALRRRTDPQTMGAYLRQHGNVELPPLMDDWVRVSLSTATVATVALSQAPADELLLLVSDGTDDLSREELEALVREYQGDPQALAEAVVAAVQKNSDGYRDDATAVVLLPR
ncbi:hypothetical protein [Kitasatospora sp. NPDC002965]|uniref:hypothetical protein n=1 Tax=Kitasatospora sp. NPDC002965 TaxID=3154775 RepID=UPI0033B0F754